MIERSKTMTQHLERVGITEKPNFSTLMKEVEGVIRESDAFEYIREEGEIFFNNLLELNTHDEQGNLLPYPRPKYSDKEILKTAQRLYPLFKTLWESCMSVIEEDKEDENKKTPSLATIEPKDIKKLRAALYDVMKTLDTSFRKRIIDETISRLKTEQLLDVRSKIFATLYYLKGESPYSIVDGALHMEPVAQKGTSAQMTGMTNYARRTQIETLI